MFKKILAYYKNNPEGYWFKRKLYGWGWVPVKWQGWLVVAAALTVGGVGYYIGEIDDSPGMIFIGFVLMFSLIFGFGSWKGEKLCWQWGLPKDTEKDNKRLALKFNEYINNRDLEGLSSLMIDDHTFTDSAGNTESGKARVKESWRGFFGAFPEYKNIFERVETSGDIVIMIGHSVCLNNKALDGSAIWVAKVANGKISEWRVYDDTPESRLNLGVQ